MRILILAAALVLGTDAAPPESPVPVQDASATPEKKLEALIQRFREHQQETYEAYDAAATEAEKSAVWAKRPGKEYAPEFRALAEEAKGTDTAVKAWMWVLDVSEDDAQVAKEVSGILLAEYIDSPALGELTGRTRDRNVLEALVADSPHERVRASALLAMGELLLQSSAESDRVQGRDCLEAVIAEYGELARGNQTFAQAAQRTLYELDHLQVGMVAPDFEAVDENGVAWKLSDYRGKVVVVDFWGFW